MPSSAWNSSNAIGPPALYVHPINAVLPCLPSFSCLHCPYSPSGPTLAVALCSPPPAIARSTPTVGIQRLEATLPTSVPPFCFKIITPSRRAVVQALVPDTVSNVSSSKSACGGRGVGVACVVAGKLRHAAGLFAKKNEKKGHEGSQSRQGT